GSSSNAMSVVAANSEPLLDTSISLPLAIRLEPPQSHRTGNELLRGHARTHRRQVVLIDHRIVRRRLQRTLRRVHDLVERSRARRAHGEAVPAANPSVVGGSNELRSAAIMA